ncbi:hypothetical protein SAMN05421803_13320 [Nocardiopsis flavescens]|uniref:DUF3558 domain-containing protein n=1 Tax=Nocardiopsis flavescens TaxID=758803 RepID=A0A1M6V9R2_9ACTN|nr:hypothetical protein [Nocardiopsis flavescens]SHK78222.1 hypothetical protein SAMN05421803_13320 [Nocardiopsis flavescens]
MVDEKAPPDKQGLHGWKAALAVFGCGTLAAFGVFGALVGIIGVFFDLTSSGIGSKPGDAQTSAELIGEPQASIDPGDIDLCSKNLQASGSLSLTRMDDGGNYEDTAGDDEWRVSDHCQWELVPDYTTSRPWSLQYSYEAVISAPDTSRVDTASEEFDARSGEIASEFHVVESEGVGDLADRSYFFYGEMSPGVTGYVILAQTRSAFYEIRIEAESESETSDLVSQNAMHREAAKLVRISEIEFEIWIPGTD